MTNELKRLRQALGTPDFQLREIQREQRMMDAASRWPILKDVAPDYSAPNRSINVKLDVAETAKAADPAIVRLQTKSAEVSVEKDTAPQPTATKSTGQLSNVFLRLKHTKKGKGGQGDDKIAVL